MGNLERMIGLNYIIKNLIVFVAGSLIGKISNAAIASFPEGRVELFKSWFRNWSCNRKKYKEKREDDHERITDKFASNIDHSFVGKIFIQLITGIIFTLIYNKYGLTAEFFSFSYIILILITMFFIDLRTKIIPDELVIAGLAGGFLVFIYNAFLPLSIYPSASWWEPLMGVLPGSGILLLIAILGMAIYKSDEVMGMGDVKIFAPIGMFLGWKMCIFALMMSMFIGGMTSILLILFRVKKRKDTIPFGPFIAIAVLVTVLYGRDIWTWYFSWT